MRRRPSSVRRNSKNVASNSARNAYNVSRIKSSRFGEAR